MKSLLKRISALEERAAQTVPMLSNAELDRQIFDLYKELREAGELDDDLAAFIELGFFESRVRLSGWKENYPDEWEVVSNICEALLAAGVEDSGAGWRPSSAVDEKPGTCLQTELA